MPVGPDRSEMSTIIFLPLRRVERYLPGLNRYSRFLSRDENAWTNVLTHKLTSTIRTTFFTDPPEEVFDHNTFNDKALEPVLSF